MSAAPPAHEVFVVNDAYYNAFTIETFLCGIYCVIFYQAMRSLRGRDKRTTVLQTALITLWVSVIVNFAVDWRIHRRGFVVDNATPFEMAEALMDSGMVLFILEGAFLTLAITIADGLLVWRCVVLWNGSKLILSILGVLFFVAFGANLAWLIASKLRTDDTSLTAIAIAWTASATLSIISTILISLRIWFSSAQSPTRRTYTRIIEILIESAALYSTGTLVVAVCNATMATHHKVHLNTAFGRRIEGMNLYSLSIQTIMTGLAPTLLVLRVGKKQYQAQVNPSNVISELAFKHSEHTNANETLMPQDSEFGLGTFNAHDMRTKSGIDSQGTSPTESHDEKSSRYKVMSESV